MKLIPKYQQGSMFQLNTARYQPYLPEQSVANPKPAGTSQSISEDLLSKETLKLLSNEGLPSDVSLFYKTVSELDSNNELNKENYYLLLQKVNEIKFNSDFYKKTMDTVISNDSLTEYAISGNQMVVLTNKGDIKTVSQTEYVKNKKIWQPMTNQDLITLRVKNPKFAFDNALLNSATQSVNPKDIVKFVDGIVSKIAAQKMTTGEYTTPEESKILEIVSSLRNGTIGEAQAKGQIGAIQNSETGYMYKQTSSMESTRTHIKEALRYIWNMMPKNYQTSMRTLAAVNGTNIEAGINSLLVDYITFSTFDDISNVQSEMKSIRDGSDGSDGSKSSSSKSDKRYDLTFAQIVANDLGTDLQKERLNFGADIGVELLSKVYNVVRDEKGEILNNIRTTDLINNSLQLFIDINHMSLAGKHVEYDELGTSLYTNGSMTVSELPYTLDDKGQVIPMFDVAEKWADAQKEIANSNDITDAVRQQILKKHGVDNIPTAKFVAVPIIVDDNETSLSFYDELDDDKYLQEIKPTGLITQLYETLFHTTEAGKKTKYDTGTDFYRGRLYAPLKQDMLLNSPKTTVAGDPNQAETISKLNSRNSTAMKVMNTNGGNLQLGW